MKLLKKYPYLPDNYKMFIIEKYVGFIACWFREDTPCGELKAP